MLAENQLNWRGLTKLNAVPSGILVALSQGMKTGTMGKSGLAAKVGRALRRCGVIRAERAKPGQRQDLLPAATSFSGGPQFGFINQDNGEAPCSLSLPR